MKGGVTAGPVADQPSRPGRLTGSAARTNVALFIHRAVRPLAPPGVGTRGPVAFGLQRVNGRPGPRSAPPAKTRKRVEEKGCDLMTRLPKAGERGFTIVELMIVVTIAGILIMLAEPSFTGATTKAREAALKQNLFTMRDVIDQFKADRGKYPAALLELKEVGYLRWIPVDPFTRSDSTWQEILDEKDGGVFDIHSGSDLVALDGTPYNLW